MDWSAPAIVAATFGEPTFAVQIEKYLERRESNKYDPLHETWSR
jgi:hypothetical protein